jgi:phosphatidylserine/phosphatidylglycerophosphate/cardiolipin synthase-like enzyme
MTAGQPEPEDDCPGGRLLEGELKIISSSPGRSKRAVFWFVLREGCLAYYPSKSSVDASSPTGVVLFDAKSSVDLNVDGDIVVCTQQTTLVLSAMTGQSAVAQEWVGAISGLLTSDPAPYDAFASPTAGNTAYPLVDGEDFFKMVSLALREAEKEILIAGWWLCPDLLLTRPGPGESPAKKGASLPWTLSDALAEAAGRGVSIKILHYRELGVALPHCSAYTETKFNLIPGSVEMIRHPHFGSQLISLLTLCGSGADESTALWSHHEKLIICDRTAAFVGGLDLAFGRYDSRDHVISMPEGDRYSSECCFPGRDWYNPRIKDFTQMHLPHEDLMSRFDNPRMPWHDVHVMVEGAAAQQVAWHFIQRWNFALDGASCGPKEYLMPLSRSESMRSERHPIGCSSPNWSAPAYPGCSVQCVRSVSSWSAGTRDTEASILACHTRLIQEAKSSIYIENQFFCTRVCRDGPQHGDEDALIRNEVGLALLERVSRAIAGKESFRAILVLPTYPSFEGDAVNSPRVLAVLRFQLGAIRSLYQELRQRHPESDLSRYINFYTLRNWGPCPRGSEPLTEQVYVHSKIMIVDDKLALIGSANINDRSMRGDRDSEFALLIGGNPEFARDLRIRLMEEHLGIPFSGSHENHSCSCSEEALPRGTGFPNLLTLKRSVGLTSMASTASMTTRSSIFSTTSSSASTISDYDGDDCFTMGEDEDGCWYGIGGDADDAASGVEGALPHCAICEQSICSDVAETPRNWARKAAADPMNDEAYRNGWHALAQHNTSIFNCAFPELPQDAHTTPALAVDALRRKLSGMPAAKLQRGQCRCRPGVGLADVRGHLLLLPTDFLCEYDFNLGLAPEAFVPATVFT